MKNFKFKNKTTDSRDFMTPKSSSTAELRFSTILEFSQERLEKRDTKKYRQERHAPMSINCLNEDNKTKTLKLFRMKKVNANTAKLFITKLSHTMQSSRVSDCYDQNLLVNSKHIFIGTSRAIQTNHLIRELDVIYGILRKSIAFLKIAKRSTNIFLDQVSLYNREGQVDREVFDHFKLYLIQWKEVKSQKEIQKLKLKILNRAKQKELLQAIDFCHQNSILMYETNKFLRSLLEKNKDFMYEAWEEVEKIPPIDLRNFDNYFQLLITYLNRMNNQIEIFFKSFAHFKQMKEVYEVNVSKISDLNEAGHTLAMLSNLRMKAENLNHYLKNFGELFLGQMKPTPES